MLHEEWMDTSVAKVGDLVRGDYIEDVVCALPPVCEGNGCTQLGEPWTHAKDEDGRYRPTFLTWHLYERNGNVWGHETLWKFDGACFARRNDNKWKGFE